MPERPVNPRELGYYMSLAQVGMEMVVPIGIGLVVDHYLGWSPWATVAGAVLGLILGLMHLVTMTNRHDANSSGQRRDTQ